MREYSTPPTMAAPTRGNLTDDLVDLLRERSDTVLFSRRDPGVPGGAVSPPGTGASATAGAGSGADDDGWRDVTAAQFHDQVTAVARGLIAAGVGPGDRVALISKTRYEWTLLDYAIWFAGAVTVPVYETSSAEQVAWILADSGARAVVVETPMHVARVAEVRGDLPGLEQVWSIADNGVDILTRLGADVPDAELEARRTAAGPGDLATLIYTSGTTGRPKGCRLTHANFMTELGVAVPELERLFETDDAATLLFLPLAHVFARIIQIGCVRAGTRVGHSADVKNLVADLQAFRPTFVLAVPRVFEKVFNTASQRATADGRGAVFDRAVDTAIAYSRALDRGRVPVALRARHAVFSRLVYGRLRGALGGHCTFAVSGGAPLGDRLGHFYRGIGLTVLEGYGLTETTGAVTVNLPDALKVGTVGRPLPGTTVRVAEDGELLFRGGQVFHGYWDDDAATADALGADGWLHTGDVGEVDDEGFVRITGRKKEILVTAGGKNVAPAVLEDRLRAHPLVDQCLVVGDGQPFVAALVTLDRDALAAWARTHRKSGDPARGVDRDRARGGRSGGGSGADGGDAGGTGAKESAKESAKEPAKEPAKDVAKDVARLVGDPDLEAEIQAAVDEANKAVSRAESIRRFRIVPEEWTEEGGQLTPSLKLRRSVVMAASRDDVAALYADG